MCCSKLYNQLNSGVRGCMQKKKLLKNMLAQSLDVNDAH